MDLGNLVERELIIRNEMERRVLLCASPQAQKRVKQAETRLAEAKENLIKAERELEEAHKMAEKTSDPILWKQLEQTRKKAQILINRQYKKRNKPKTKLV